MDSKPPKTDLGDAVRRTSWDIFQLPAEEIQVSNIVAATINYAPALSAQVNDHVDKPLSPSSVDNESHERQNSALVVTSDADNKAAVRLSLEEANTQKRKDHDLKWDRLLNGEDVSDMKGNSPNTGNDRETVGRPSLEDRIQELSLNGASGPPLVHDPLGDTYIFIDPPAQQPEQDENSYLFYVQRCKTPMLMKKSTLLSFSSFFENMFGPTYQYNIIRRRGLVRKLPPNVKYVINLTPPAEGDAAVNLMTDLCCSDGVRKWFQASERWEVSKTLVGGHDEYMSLPKLQKPVRPVGTFHLDSYGNNDSSPSSLSRDVPLPVAYSPIRHRSAIERVLAAMQGLDPMLNSAPKVWTTFAVAKSYEITNSSLTDYIVSWLRATPNSYFLEVMPEISLRIADGLKCEDLCRDVFAILIGEEALDLSRRAANESFGTEVSVHGRKKDYLPEFYVTSLQYGSRAFAERIMDEFQFLVDRNMYWFDYLPEFKKLDFDGPLAVNAENELLALRSMLQVYVRSTIYKVLLTNFEFMSTLDIGHPGGDDLFPNQTLSSIWKTLSPRERILTRSFWKALQSCKLFTGPTNLDLGSGLDGFYPEDGVTTAEAELRDRCTMEPVNTVDIEGMAMRLNQWSVYNSSQGVKVPVEDNDPGTISRSKVPWKNFLLPLGKPKSKNTVPEPEAGSGGSDRSSWDYEWEHNSTDNLLPGKQEFSSLVAAQLAVGLENHSSGEPSPTIHKKLEDGKKLEDHLFDLPKFLVQCRRYLGQITERMLAPPDAGRRVQTLELSLTNTLVCLKDSEWKLLPLWAGGNNDGSQGVYEPDVPPSHTGFSTAGPKVRTVDSPPSSIDFTIVNSSTTSNERTSLQTNDGLSSAFPIGQVVSAEGSMASDDHFSSHTCTTPFGEGNEGVEDQVSISTHDSDYSFLTPVQSEDIDEVERSARLIAFLEEEEKSGDLADKEKAKKDDEEVYDEMFNGTVDEDSDETDGDYNEDYGDSDEDDDTDGEEDDTDEDSDDDGTTTIAV